MIESAVLRLEPAGDGEVTDPFAVRDVDGRGRLDRATWTDEEHLVLIARLAPRVGRRGDDPPRLVETNEGRRRHAYGDHLLQHPCAGRRPVVVIMPVVLVAAVVVTPVVVVAATAPVIATFRGLHDAVGVVSDSCARLVRADSANRHQHHARERLERGGAENLESNHCYRRLRAENEWALNESRTVDVAFIRWFPLPCSRLQHRVIRQEMCDHRDEALGVR